jgi:8-oxo-dGTP diphosphatase
MENQAIKDQIRRLVSSIIPYDQIEQHHIDDVCAWIAEGAPIYRIQKDAIPPKHMVSYALVVDPVREKMLLFDHKKAQRMLPAGGHAEINEMPFHAAQRELREELGLTLESYTPDNRPAEVPFFVSVTGTVGTSEPHTDVSLWFVFILDSTSHLRVDGDEFDKEFDAFHWLFYDEILALPIEKLDPHIHRVIRKIKDNRLLSLAVYAGK